MTTIQEKKVELLREKNIKSMECSNKATGYELRDFFNLNEQTPTNDLKHLRRAYMDEIEEPAIGSLSVGGKPESPVSTDWLNDRHCRDTETIGKLERRVRELEKERYAEIERGDNWRNKYSFTDNEMEKREIENRNLKFEIEQLNQLLEKTHANDKLMDGVMRLYLDTKGKLIDSVDGEVSDKWR